jgi:hypothetical protein
VKPGLHWYTPELTLSVEFFGIQGPPRGPLHHASHTQSVMFWLPADEFEFSGQRVQFEVPLESLYVPGRQALHWPLETPVSGPVYPVLHEHSIVDKQLTVSHGVLVKSTPCFMALAMAVVESVLRNSSTTKTPATSPFKYGSPQWLLPM